MFDSLESHLNRHCSCVGTDVRHLRRQLAGQVEPSLETSHPHLFSELPVFIAERDRSTMQAIIRSIESIAALPKYRQLVRDRSPRTESLEYSSPGILSYDFHITEAGPKLIEINTNPGGTLLVAEMLKAQSRCCDLVGEYIDTAFEPSKVEQQVVDAFRLEWSSARGLQPLKTIAIVDDAPSNQFLYPEFLLYRNLFTRHGIDTVIAAPEELHRENGRLFAGKVAIDLVYNRLTDFNLNNAASTVIRDALQADEVVVTPNPSAHALYANKSNLEILSDAELLRSLGAPSPTIEVLLNGIPRTLSVKDADANAWWSERKAWFFKPATGFGSKGSYRGDKVTRSTFADITRGGYVAQRLAPPAERALQDSSVLKFDVRNYTYRGKTILSAARLYQGQTTNFRTVGGGFAPIYTLRHAS